MTRTIALLSTAAALTAFAILLPIENASALRKCDSSEMQECFDHAVEQCAHWNGHEGKVEGMMGDLGMQKPGTDNRRRCEAGSNETCRSEKGCQAP